MEYNETIDKWLHPARAVKNSKIPPFMKWWYKEGGVLEGKVHSYDEWGNHVSFFSMPGKMGLWPSEVSIVLKLRLHAG